MTHSKEEELDSATHLLEEVLEYLDLPMWDDLGDSEKKHVIKLLNERLSEKFGDHIRHFMFGVKYDVTNQLHLIAIPI